MPNRSHYNFQAAIFDLDGVVVDTVSFHFQAWKMMFGEYGREFDFEAYKKYVDGIPRFEGAKAILFDFSDGQIQKACDKKQAYYLDFIQKNEIPRFESTFRLIQELKLQSIQVAIISASRNCRQTIQRIDAVHLVDGIVDGSEVAKGKPDPEMFLCAAQKLGCDVSRCVVFEDAVLGVEAAKRAQMKCVGIDRYGEPGRLHKADMVVSDLAYIDYQKLCSLFS